MLPEQNVHQPAPHDAATGLIMAQLDYNAQLSANHTDKSDDMHTLQAFIKLQESSMQLNSTQHDGTTNGTHHLLQKSFDLDGLSAAPGLEFEELTYVVSKWLRKDGEKVSKEVRLLSGISGKAIKGELTAVMGPSGAGKSTLLDALAGRIAKGSLGGSVKIDGRQISASMMKKISAYVMQDDQLFPMLTVNETLMFAAQVRLPSTMSKEAKKSRVNDLLDQLGLQMVAHTYIGDQGTRGVSGGERRRVSIGVDIIHDPKLLFLDEPTSGLDSTNALHVVEKLVDIARCGSTIMLTIHQPCYRVQALLNKILVLARGMLVYAGTADGLHDYFSIFSREMPVGENPLEFLLDVIKEYDESTVGLEPLVQFQRDGVKPSETAKTPQRRMPALVGGEMGWNPASAVAGQLDEEDFDYSLERFNATPMNNVGNLKLASQFYQDFSVWLYTEMVKGTPARPTWPVTPGRTPGLTPGRTPRRTTTAAINQGGNVNVETIREAVEVIAADVEVDPGGADYPSASADSSEEEGGARFANAWAEELRILMWRNVLNVIRTPELFLSRELLFTVMSFMFATMYKALSSPDDITTAYNLLNFFIFSSSLMFFSSNDAIPAFIQERYIFIRETSHNAYRVSCYVVASFLVNLSFFAVQAFTFAVITFFAMKLQGSFSTLWLILYASLISSNSFVSFVSAMVPNFVTGYSVVIASTSLFFLTCGFFLKRTLIPPYWQWLHYISSIKYPFEGLLINQFNSKPYFCYSVTDHPSAGPVGKLKQDPRFTGRPPGCTIAGPDILYTMDINQHSILVDVLVLLAWGALYRLFFYVILRFYSKNLRK